MTRLVDSAISVRGPETIGGVAALAVCSCGCVSTSRQGEQWLDFAGQDDEFKLRTYGTAGHLHRITLENFMCHQHFTMVGLTTCPY